MLRFLSAPPFHPCSYLHFHRPPILGLATLLMYNFLIKNLFIFQLFISDLTTVLKKLLNCVQDFLDPVKTETS